MKKVSVTFSRTYEVEIPSHENDEQGIVIARQEFDSEIEFLDASSDYFSVKINEVIIKEDK